MRRLQLAIRDLHTEAIFELRHDVYQRQRVHLLADRQIAFWRSRHWLGSVCGGLQKFRNEEAELGLCHGYRDWTRHNHE